MRRSRHAVYELKYHLVWVPKYRKRLLVGGIKDYLEGIFREVGERYEMSVEEIGIQKDHVHLFVEVAPSYSVSDAVRIFKSITAKKVFEKFPEVRDELWGGEFWSDGYFARSVGDKATEEMIRKYVRKQGVEQIEFGF